MMGPILIIQKYYENVYSSSVWSRMQRCTRCGKEGAR